MRDTLARVGREIIACRTCPRLVAHRERIAREKRRAYRDWSYWGRPVPGFGDPRARLVVVGLAPGAHGANRTGRLFTGDSSGDTLFAALHACGFASRAESVARDDGLTLDDCYITAVLRCAPPANRPQRAELPRCRPFLLRELRLLRRTQIYLALGRIAFDTLRRALPELGVALREARPRFSHGAEFALEDGGRHLLCSYHPSRQNTQTGRLTQSAFRRVFRRARGFLDAA